MSAKTSPIPLQTNRPCPESVSPESNVAAFCLLNRLLSGEEIGPHARARLLVLRLLLEGLTHQQVAKRLGMTRQNVSHHATKLVEGRALAILYPRPLIYTAGDELAPFIAGHGRAYGGWVALDAGTPLGRVHGWSVVAKVVGRNPARPPLPVRKEWTAGGGRTHHIASDIAIGARAAVAVVWCSGPRRSTLTVYPRAFYALGETSLARCREVATQEALRVLALLEGRHGFGFGTVRFGAGPEVAFPAPGLAFLSGWKRPDVGHVDCSMGGPEIETDQWHRAIAEMRRREAPGERAPRGILDALWPP